MSDFEPQTTRPKAIWMDAWIFDQLSDEQLIALWNVDSLAVRIGFLLAAAGSVVSILAFFEPGFGVGFAVGMVGASVAFVQMLKLAQTAKQPLDDLRPFIRLWAYASRFFRAPVQGRRPHEAIYRLFLLGVALYFVGFAAFFLLGTLGGALLGPPAGPP